MSLLTSAFPSRVLVPIQPDSSVRLTVMIEFASPVAMPIYTIAYMKGSDFDSRASFCLALRKFIRHNYHGETYGIDVQVTFGLRDDFASPDWMVQSRLRTLTYNGGMDSFL